VDKLSGGLDYKDCDNLVVDSNQVNIAEQVDTADNNSVGIVVDTVADIGDMNSQDLRIGSRHRVKK
jgi:hypothetical protein